ncbi:hypothetical protein ACFQGS_18965 [Novosphingobium lubricantis]
MISEPFDPADEATWIARGRRPDHAAILADAWRRFPDLPNDADREARRARMRQRALALRPVMDAMSKAADAERQARNFAFTETRIASGKGDDRDRAILRARNLHRYDWDRAVRYASGWFAATAGWEPEARRGQGETPATLAYEEGFADGGGNRDDLFDTARRAYDAASLPEAQPVPTTGRPLPSTGPSRPTIRSPRGGRVASLSSARPKRDGSAKARPRRSSPRSCSQLSRRARGKTNSPSS